VTHYKLVVNVNLEPRLLSLAAKQDVFPGARDWMLEPGIRHRFEHAPPNQQTASADLTHLAQTDRLR
jgi:hypothetical protein